MKWIDSVDCSRTTEKTKRFELRAKQDGALLGTVQWFGRWRRYVFMPAPSTIFETDCLNDIRAFLDELTAEWKAGRVGK
jgi:hypothetical protein